MSDPLHGLDPAGLMAAAAMPTDGDADTLPLQRTDLPSQAEIAAAFPDLEILGLIGHGGMSAVFKARQPKLDRVVALKVLPKSLAATPGFAERFHREGRVLAWRVQPLGTVDDDQPPAFVELPGQGRVGVEPADPGPFGPQLPRQRREPLGRHTEGRGHDRRVGAPRPGRAGGPADLVAISGGGGTLLLIKFDFLFVFANLPVKIRHAAVGTLARIRVQ